MNSNSVFELRWIVKEEREIALPLLRYLNEEKTDEAILHHLYQVMNQPNYRLLGVYEEGRLIAITGVWSLYKIYIGKHLEMDNVIVLPEYRNRKIGELLIEEIKNIALKEKCASIELNCYLHNPKGIEFWRNNGFVEKGYHMIWYNEE